MKHDSHDDMTVNITPAGSRTTPEERLSAALTVVESCPDDARLMLAMLGLDDA